MKIAVLTCSTKNRKWLYDITNKTKIKYCKKFGYDFVFDGNYYPDRNRKAYWNKVKFILDNIDKYDYLIWLDDDAGFISYTKSFSDILHEFSYTADFNGFNAGMMVIECSDTNKQIFDFIWNEMYNAYKDHKYPEQDAIKTIMIDRLNIGTELDARIYNAYDKSIAGEQKNNRIEDTLILHIANGPSWKENNKDKIKSLFQDFI